MVRRSEPKSFGEYTKKDWQKFIWYVAFFGIFMSGLGLYAKSWDTIWLGIIFVIISVAAGFVLHFFFGIKIIDLRRDFKNKKF
ncbi:Uncharacterised protein [uncultured archaeon]|nr:Uncharacterised protein [uncultured archaeon]